MENQVVVTTPIGSPVDIEASITKALQRHAGLDLENLGMSSEKSVVALTGTVRSRAERDAAVAGGWPRLTGVHDHLTVWH